MTYDAVIETLRPLLAAEIGAELPVPTPAAEPGDVEQAVWLRLLERLGAHGPPGDLAAWLSCAVRAEARRQRRTAARHEPLYGTEPAADARATDPELRLLARERTRSLHAAVRRLPGRCPRLIRALLSPQDLTYREIAGELGISQGSLGPERARCLGCLRRILSPEVARTARRGNGEGQPVNR
ncbi:sigma-70 family RNA polymerase sigma factor [Streptomyces beihaiensis]|uniref:Sigma-70 family RNA polymerase sigma factor n=1 Tax=Streptomyces beihaiensis TaxID=2984495 RepID=A0ABT3U2T2_9ACTN|nr:sigma-70 family RNA polymerase sigma factor [Streptomyces beihaiensis]MCX3062518.1 sigma-70 family RNA polymerase sigma factor [Streptomyces beihaiensis]